MKRKKDRIGERVQILGIYATKKTVGRKHM